MVSRIAPPPKPPKGKRRGNVVTGITLIGQIPALEHVKNGHDGKRWRVWLSYDDDYTSGVYLQLEPDGSIVRYSVLRGKINKVVTIKDKD